jgi:signal transduction histidine kinase
MRTSTAIPPNDIASSDSPTAARTVVVLDAVPSTLNPARDLLGRSGYRVLAASSPADALATLSQDAVHVLVVDAATGLDLVAFARQVRAHDPLVQIVVRAPASEALRARTATTPILAWHDSDAPLAQLVPWVDAAQRTYEQVAHLHVKERLKSEFLANVSHEFRTPLNVILGYMELLREGTFGACPTEAEGVFGKVVGNAAYLLDLIEELLDLARLESGKATFDAEPLALGPFLNELAELSALLVRDKPIRFVADIPSDLPFVTAEAAKLRVVVQNLIANATKYTVAGEVRLAAARHGHDRIAIAVQDTGPGIPSEHHEAIFDVFQRLRTQEEHAKGVGLGLALARRFARMMGGDITLQSAVGVGSTFTVVLPTVGEVEVEEREAVA